MSINNQLQNNFSTYFLLEIRKLHFINFIALDIVMHLFYFITINRRKLFYATPNYLTIRLVNFIILKKTRNQSLRQEQTMNLFAIHSDHYHETSLFNNMRGVNNLSTQGSTL